MNPRGKHLIDAVDPEESGHVTQPADETEWPSLDEAAPQRRRRSKESIRRIKRRRRIRTLVIVLLVIGAIVAAGWGFVSHSVSQGKRKIEEKTQKVIKAKDIDSEVTGMSTGHPIRVLRNKMTRQYLKLEKEGAPFEELEKMTLGALRKAVVDGDTVYGSVMAGQSAGLVKKEETCKEIIEDVVGLNK